MNSLWAQCHQLSWAIFFLFINIKNKLFILISEYFWDWLLIIDILIKICNTKVHWETKIIIIYLWLKRILVCINLFKLSDYCTTLCNYSRKQQKYNIFSKRISFLHIGLFIFFCKLKREKINCRTFCMNDRITGGTSFYFTFFSFPPFKKISWR